MKICLEYEVDGVNQVRKHKTGCDERPCQAEPPEIGNLVGEVLEPFKKGWMITGEEFVGKDVEASDSDLGITQYPGRDKGEQSDKGDGAEDSEIGCRNGQIGTPVLDEPLESFPNDGK